VEPAPRKACGNGAADRHHDAETGNDPGVLVHRLVRSEALRDGEERNDTDPRAHHRPEEESEPGTLIWTHRTIVYPTRSVVLADGDSEAADPIFEGFIAFLVAWGVSQITFKVDAEPVGHGAHGTRDCGSSRPLADRPSGATVGIA